MTGSTSDLAPHADDRWADNAAAYAIGALDPAEAAAFEAHLAACEACAAEVREYRAVATLLARGMGGAAPAPSPALRARIVATARADAEPATPARRLHSRTATASIRAVAPPRPRAAWAPWLAAAASFVVAAGLGAGWARERQARVAERHVAASALDRDSLLAAVTAPDVRVARLAVRGAPAAMRLLWNPAKGVVLLTAAALPPPRPGRTYQLWGIPPGRPPRSLGVFTPEIRGGVWAVLRVPPEAEMAVAAVTEEPAGGSAQPTSQPLMVGQVEGE